MNKWAFSLVQLKVESKIGNERLFGTINLFE